MENILFEHKTSPVSLGFQHILSNIPHYHREIEIIHAREGESMVYADNESYLIKEGDIFICFPRQIHYYNCPKKGRFNVIIFNPSILYGVKDIMETNVPVSNVIRRDNAVEIGELFEKAMEFKGEYKSTVVAGLLNQAVGLCLSNIETKPKSNKGKTVFQSLLGYCSDNFDDDITLESTAQSLHISKFHISHLMNEKLGISFSTYINMLRVDKARTLLVESDKRISDISEEVGFGSIRSFNRAFLEITGNTPKDYRDKHIKK